MSKKPPVIVSYFTPVISVRFIETLLDESSAILLRYGESREQTEKVSREFVVETCRKLGGALLYIGKNTRVEAQQRRYQIREEFNNGASDEELSGKYQLSTRMIIAIRREIRDAEPAKAAAKGTELIAITAVRMFMKIGENSQDAANVARGILAVITAKFGGKQFNAPCGKNLVRILRMIEVYRLDMSGYSHAAIAARFNLTEDQVTEISDAYPTSNMPDSSELPKIKKQLFNYAKTFSYYSEINTLLESAAQNISRSEEIIKKLEGAKL